jgi:hypothetical protein
MTDVTQDSPADHPLSPSADRAGPPTIPRNARAARAFLEARGVRLPGPAEPVDRRGFPLCAAMHPFDTLAVVVLKYREGPGLSVSGFRSEPLCKTCADALPGWFQARVVARLSPDEWDGTINAPPPAAEQGELAGMPPPRPPHRHRPGARD